MPDYVVFLQPTSPFRNHVDINKGIRKILETNSTSLVGVANIDQHPYWMFKKNNSKLFEFLKEKNKPTRRQDLPKLYYINDALYISKYMYFKTASFTKPIIDLNDLTGLEMTRLHSFDINTELDFKIAEYLHKSFQQNDFPLL